ncbi:MAG: hypothetical protein WCI20_11350, partial [bacterium]
LGKSDLSGIARGTKAEHIPGLASSNGDEMNAFKIRCPECGGVLIFEEGCNKCHGCGYAQC